MTARGIEAPTAREGIGRWSRTWIAVVVGLAAILLVSTASLASGQVLGVGLAVGGLVAVVVSRRNPVVCLFIVACLALSSATTIDIASVNIRVEQPAVLFLACYALLVSRDLVTRLVRQYWFLIVALVVWLGSDVMSSAFVAPDPIASLRIVGWLGISVTAGGVAAVLAVRAERFESVIGALVAAAAVQVAIAVLAAASGRVLGVDWGGYGPAGDGFGFRATGLALEANIFASGTAIAVPLAIAKYIGSGRRWDLAVVALLGLGVWVALTRTVFVALGLGLAAFLCLLIWRQRGAASRWLPKFATGVIALVLGLGAGVLVTLAASSSTPGILAVRNPGSDLAVLPPRAGSTPAPLAGSGQGSGPGSTVTPAGSTSGTAGPTVFMPIDLVDASTLEFRLVRLRESLSDLQASPLIGMGANSFGQRHADPSQSFKSDHLAMLPFTIVYDAGLLGLAGFLVFFLGIALVLLRWRVPAASASFAASIAIMLASYATTDALRFAWNWLLIGAALGLAYRWRAGTIPQGDTPSEVTS